MTGRVLNTSEPSGNSPAKRFRIGEHGQLGPVIDSEAVALPLHYQVNTTITEEHTALEAAVPALAGKRVIQYKPHQEGELVRFDESLSDREGFDDDVIDATGHESMFAPGGFFWTPPQSERDRAEYIAQQLYFDPEEDPPAFRPSSYEYGWRLAYGRRYDYGGFQSEDLFLAEPEGPWGTDVSGGNAWWLYTSPIWTEDLGGPDTGLWTIAFYTPRPVRDLVGGEDDVGAGLSGANRFDYRSRNNFNGHLPTLFHLTFLFRVFFEGDEVPDKNPLSKQIRLFLIGEGYDLKFAFPEYVMLEPFYP
ncbi:MAG: hypothetical protein CMJ46_16180 [Planctomyces sp.]|nr:hypothetical protein [Planctomyces sp.]